MIIGKGGKKLKEIGAASRKDIEELLAQKPELAGKTLYEVLFENGSVDRYPVSDTADGFAIGTDSRA